MLPSLSPSIRSNPSRRSNATWLPLVFVGTIGFVLLTGCTIAQSDSDASSAQNTTDPIDATVAASAFPVPTSSGIDAASAIGPSTAVVGVSDASVWLQNLTSPEVRQRLDSGTTTIIIPTGGIEQNGPHMALDKHQVVVAYTAERIATGVGNTLVAPVMAYVPEGDPAIMDNHLQWPGTISVTENVFAQVLESVSTSLANEGFTTIAFLGDSGSSQTVQRQVADELSTRWADRSIAVVNLDAYYEAGSDAAPAVAAGVDPGVIGTHAGVLDTSQVMALRPDLIRSDQLHNSGSSNGLTPEGFDGDPTQANPTVGQAILDAKVEAGIAQLSAAR